MKVNMQNVGFILGVIYTLILICMSIIAINMTFKTIFFLKKTFSIKNVNLHKNNISAGIYYAGVIFSMTLISKNSVSSGMNFLQSQIYQDDIQINDLAYTLGLIFLQFVISFIASIFSIIISEKIYDHLTGDVNELEEIYKNNIAVGVVFSAVLISVSLFIAPGIELIVESLVPFHAH